MNSLIQRTCGLLLLLTVPAFSAVTDSVIVDSKVQTQGASVDTNGKLQVELAAPSTFWHSNFARVSGCTIIAVASSTTGLIVRQVRVNVSTYNFNSGYDIYADKTCSKIIAEGTPYGAGQVVVPFDPGLVIAKGGGMSASTWGSTTITTVVDGYTTP